MVRSQTGKKGSVLGPMLFIIFINDIDSPVVSSLVKFAVPQGSILGPMLFVIFINDIYSTVVSSLVKFADDTKTLRQVPEVEYAFTLHEDFHSMYKWSQNWQLLFNFTKCKYLHIGYNNPNYDYFMGDVRQESIDMEKDLGVHIHKSLKVKEQINYVVKKANRILGTIRRTYTDKSVKNIKNLYITLVRPIIENCQ